MVKINRIYAVCMLILILFIPIKSIGQISYTLDFYEHDFELTYDSTIQIPFDKELSQMHIQDFYTSLNQSAITPVISALSAYQKTYALNDWMLYQLVRKVAEKISPKSSNYSRYTLYKWYLMSKLGYDCQLAIADNQIIFYIYCEEDIHDIPYFEIQGKNYFCLNYHDYGILFQAEGKYIPIDIKVAEAIQPFSYKVTIMPEFKTKDYIAKKISFDYRHKRYNFQVKLNPIITAVFANYPGVDYETYFNIPLSKVTYESLIPLLKKNTKALSQQEGIDYLMRFTRYAFLYENDEQHFGKEKRMAPEETLLSPASDCDDRAALFFYLVKEIYNLPMIALLYPTHISIAVGIEHPIGQTIQYAGQEFTICEPTPQAQDLQLGELPEGLRNTAFEIVYHYSPK